MLAAVDSYWQYVSTQMETVNPARQMIAVSDAMDWPPKQVIFEAFYLLVVAQKPVGKSFWSADTPVLSIGLQWVWMIQGTDLQTGKVGRSRGDRYRTNMTMREELLKATYPWWTQKQQWSLLGDTPAGLALAATPFSPAQYIWWTPLDFTNRIDKDSGLVYGTATTFLTDMMDQPISASI